MNTLTRVLAFGALGVFLALSAAACGDDDAQSNSNAQQSDIEATNARVQRNEVLFALKSINDIPLHDIDESINAGQVEGDYLPYARDVIVVTGVTNWPAELEGAAMEMQDAAVDLAAALSDGDTEAAKQPATDLHAVWHDFEHDALAWAAQGSNIPDEAGVRDSHGDGATETTETPAAHETASGGDDHGE